MALAKADGNTNPKHIPLLKQDLWVQVRGLPLGYMTSTMRKIIGDALGGYMVTDQSKKMEKLGSYLCIRVTLNFSKLLRWSLLLRLTENPLKMM
ncbi:hypothetical protein CerSpe_204900 [Prunus speciosa]